MKYRVTEKHAPLFYPTDPEIVARLLAGEDVAVRNDKGEIVEHVPSTVRREAGDVVDDVPACSVGWLLEDGAIVVVEDVTPPAAMKTTPTSATATKAGV